MVMSMSELRSWTWPLLYQPIFPPLKQSKHSLVWALPCSVRGMIHQGSHTKLALHAYLSYDELHSSRLHCRCLWLGWSLQWRSAFYGKQSSKEPSPRPPQDTWVNMLGGRLHHSSHCHSLWVWYRHWDCMRYTTFPCFCYLRNLVA